MGALLAVFASFEREILGERVRAGLAHAPAEWPAAGSTFNRRTIRPEDRETIWLVSDKSEISRRFNIGRTSVRRILAAQVKRK